MKAFKFRLETLLKVRRLKEDAARRDLALARQAVLDQNQALARLRKEEEDGKKALRTMKMESLDVMRLRLQETWLDSVARRIRQGYEKLQDLLKSEGEKRRALTEAMKGVRVLERLRERQYRTYLYEGDRQEQKFLDEVAGNGLREVGP